MFHHISTNLVVRTEAASDDNQSLCLRLSGELTSDGVHILKQAIEPLFVSPLPPRLELIMEDIKYMDSSGIGIIIAIIQRMQDSGGKLEIHGLNDAGRGLFKILKIASLNDIVTIKSQTKT